MLRQDSEFQLVGQSTAEYYKEDTTTDQCLRVKPRRLQLNYSMLEPMGTYLYFFPSKKTADDSCNALPSSQ